MVVSSSRNSAYFAMVLLVLLSGCSMFGGDSTDPIENLREQVRAVVTDPTRAQDMLATVDRIDQLLVESADILADAAQQERRLFADYDSTPRDYEKLFMEASRERQRLQQTILAAHLEFKSIATPGEWQAIRPVQVNAVSARVESLLLAAIDKR